MRFWLAGLLSLFAVCALAQDTKTIDPAKEPFTAGKEYRMLDESMAKNTTAKASLATDPNRVEVLAFFNYGCPVCNRMEPVVEKWYQGKEELQIVAFKDVPVVWSHPGWDNLARAFYIAEASGTLDKVHPALFRAVHQGGKKFVEKSELEEFFLSEAGMKREQFNELYDSFNTRRRMKQGELLREAYQIKSIPAFVVNGKYYVDIQTAGGMQQVTQVLEYLVNKESFHEGVEEVKFDDVSGGIDHSEDDVFKLEDVETNAPVQPSTAP